MGRKLFRAAIAAAAAGVLILFGALSSGASAGIALIPGAPPGTNAFITNPEGTHLNAQIFQPAHPGCTVLSTELHFGPPLNGGVDTVVQRLEPVPSNPPPDHPVPIEIVELSLQSIAPLAVDCGGDIQNWDVFVSLSDSQPQQQGQMMVNQTGPSTGQAAGNLPVIPKAVMTRVDPGAGGEVKAIDVGDFPGLWNNFNLNFAFPYELGAECPKPTNSAEQNGFCILDRFEGEAPVVRHDALPSHPVVEHFKCYQPKRLKGKAKKKAKFKPVKVKMVDQFGLRQGKAKKRKELCNPVQKKREPWVNRAAHEQCYQVGGPALNRPVDISNQFGIQGLIVGKPRRLCLPTEKKELPRGKLNPIATAIEHFTCYDVEIQTPLYNPAGQPPKKIRTKDQFGSEKVKLGAPKWLCAPTDKNDEGMLSPLEHQVCYSIKGKNVRAKVKIKNQFESKKVKYKKPKYLCLPSYKHARAQGVTF